jgi:hypothetical protein
MAIIPVKTGRNLLGFLKRAMRNKDVPNKPPRIVLKDKGEETAQNLAAAMTKALKDRRRKFAGMVGKVRVVEAGKHICLTGRVEKGSGHFLSIIMHVERKTGATNGNSSRPCRWEVTLDSCLILNSL